MSGNMDMGLPKGGVGEFWLRSKRQGRQRLKQEKERRMERIGEVRRRGDAPSFSENES